MSKGRQQGEYDELIYGIIQQAVIDYVWSREYVREKGDLYRDLRVIYPQGVKRETGDAIPGRVVDIFHKYEFAQRTIPECEKFFLSEWFMLLAPEYDGAEVLKQLQRVSYKQLKKRMY